MIINSLQSAPDWMENLSFKILDKIVVVSSAERSRAGGQQNDGQDRQRDKGTVLTDVSHQYRDGWPNFLSEGEANN
ncbi:hypothetical protein EVAR_3767_1 [Eumeta japonica]|uniref:Uncharacterized protein n=1 Tax=Eumeta variegata TaxID=151549 RepID=A0A4C1SRS7_EUMVA|nr:hypothetical protein EVAR_3767_1 [Eumeta japonica]